MGPLHDGLTGPEHALTGAARVPGPPGAPARAPAAGTPVLDTALAAVDKLLSVTGNAVAAASPGETPLDVAFRAAVVEMAAHEAKAAVTKLPLGKVLITTFQLSVAFAEGVGEAVVAVHAKEDENRRAIGARGPLDALDANIEEIRYESAYLARAARELGPVVTRALGRVAETAVDLLFDAASDALRSAVSGVAQQVAVAIPKQFDLVEQFSTVARSAAGVPAARARIYRTLLGPLATTAVRQYASAPTAKALAPLLTKVGSDLPIDVALAAGVIEVLANGVGATYARAVPVAEAADELRLLVRAEARGLVTRLVAAGITVEPGATVEAHRDLLVVPDGLFAALTVGRPEPPGTSLAFLAAEAGYFSASDRLMGSVDVLVAAAQRTVDAAHARLEAGSIVDRTYDDTVNRVVANVNRRCDVIRQQLAERRKTIIRTYGDEVAGRGPLDTWFTLVPDRLNCGRRLNLHR